jgi:predicted nucleic acid-binding protein
MKTVFLDASYVIALELANDQNHHSAVQHWKDSDAAGLPQLVTTSYVFNEVVTYLNSRGLHTKAVDVGEYLVHSPLVRMTQVDEKLFERAWEFFMQHRDKRYSLSDCAAFIVMRDSGLTTAFTFDHHFRQAGFQTQP